MTGRVYSRTLFTITVSSRDERADWYGVMRPQTVEASSLAEALTKAQAIPFRDWFVDEDGEDAVTIRTDQEDRDV